MCTENEQSIKLNYPVEVMRFTLLYDGSLPAQTNHDARIDRKHAIRSEFHSQLLEVWQTKPVLRQKYENWMAASEDQRINASRDDLTETQGALMKQFTRGQFKFVPLVTERAKLIAELDILFLRKEPPGSLFTTNKAGDLDNRIKVLFDALRVPKEASELPASALPTRDQDPFLCLLENDHLITAVRLESERLYESRGQRDRVRLVVKVTVKTQEFRMDTIDIAND